MYSYYSNDDNYESDDSNAFNEPELKQNNNEVADILRLKREMGVKNIRELKKLGVINWCITVDYEELSIDFTYDEDGLCMYKPDNISTYRQIHWKYDGAIYTTKNIVTILEIPQFDWECYNHSAHAILTAHNLDPNYKFEKLDKIFTKQPKLKGTIYNNKKNLLSIIQALDNGAYPPMVDFMLKDIEQLTNYKYKKVSVSLDEILENDVIITHYCIYKELCKYSNKVRYMPCDNDVAYLYEIPEDDFIFAPNNHKYLWRNKNEIVVGHLMNFMSQDEIESSLREEKLIISDESYRLIWNLLPNRFCYHGLSNLSNIVHRLQVKFNIRSELYFGILEELGIFKSAESLYTLNSLDRLFEISNFLFGNNNNILIFRSAACIKNIRLDSIQPNYFTFRPTGKLVSEEYIIYKHLKYAMRSPLDAIIIESLVKTFHNQEFIVNMLLENHYCVIDRNVVNKVCELTNLENSSIFEVIKPYLPAELVKLHRCRHENCILKKSIICRVKSAHSR